MPSFARNPSYVELEPAVPGEGREALLEREELVVVHDPGSEVAEQFRRLRNSVLALNPEGASRVVLLTSAVEGEGKTTATLNLALAMVELPHLRVCVLDANRVHPSVEELLGLPRRQGLTEVLSGTLALDAGVRATSVARLDVLGAGAPSAERVLNLDRMRTLLNTLKRNYDYVLIDAPPVLRANQPSLLASIADGILLVVRIGATPKQEVEEAYTMLENLGGNVLGTCATGADA